MSTSRRVALRDIGIVAGACALYVALELSAVPKLWSFALCGVMLFAFLAHVIARRSDTWRDFGFRTDNLLAAGVPVLGGTLVVATGLIAWATASGRVVPVRDIALLLALYPAWAAIQQFVFQGVLHRRLTTVVRSPAAQVVLTAAAFAAVHAGNAALVLLTFLAGILWSLAYRRWPNLYVLAASHAVLAAVVYPLVLADAPLSRL